MTRYRVDELVPVYRRRRAELQRLLDEHYAADAPVRWTDDGVRACFRCPECTIKVRETDDLLLVANMRVSQRARLINAGITTRTELAQHHGPVHDLSDPHGGVADRPGPAAGRAARVTASRRTRWPTRSR